MKVVFLCALAFAALVSTIEAGCQCDEDFSGFGTEPGKCGCCPWPCCCKCFETETSDCTTQSPPTTTATTTTIRPTTPGRPCPCLDLTFIVDESGSISETEDWPEMLAFCDGIVQTLYQYVKDECGDVINVAFITFGTNATLQWNLKPSQECEILEIVQGKKQTNPVEAIEIAVNEVYADVSECIPVVIYITDGRAEFREHEIPEAGIQLRAAVDDNVYCIGVTTAFNQTQMDQVCPNQDRQYSTLAFDLLNDEIGSKLEVQIIQEAFVPLPTLPESETTTTTTTTPPPTDACVRIITEECFCCCSPEQYWGGFGRGHY